MKKYLINIANKQKYGRIVLEIRHSSDGAKDCDINSELKERNKQEDCGRRKK